jgi:carboxymethylenebutenolidase
MKLNTMNKLLALLAALSVAATASAQDWAKAKLEKSPRHGEFVKVKHDGREVECWVVYPEVKEKAATILVIHEIFGLSDWARVAADEFAAAGYIAIAPDLLSGKGPDGGGTASLKSDQIGRAIMGLPADQVTADLQAAADYATKLPAANGKLAVAGFCWGGKQTFRFATNNKEMKAACVFYGDGPPNTDLPRISCPVYGFYAGTDGRIGQTLSATTEGMKAAGKSYDPVTYEGAGHGFMRMGEAPEATDANKKAREESWTRLKQILGKI